MKTRADLDPKQLQAAEFIRTRLNCALWMDMGLGKTISTLTAIAYLFENFYVRRVLVVAPLRVARKVWSDEVKAWAHVNHLTVSCVTGTEKERLAALNAGADIYTINRENLQWLESLFVDEKDRQIRRWPWDLVVFDEAQSFKNAGKRSRVLRRMRKFFPRCVQLTGTPAPNGYEDIYGQIYLLDKGERLGRTKTAYLRKWFTPPATMFGKWQLKSGAKEEIHAALKDIVLAIRDMHPPVPINPIRVDLGPELLAQYRKFKRETVMQFAGQTFTAANAGALTGKLLQFANGAIYRPDGSWQHIHDHKLDALEELIDNRQGPVMVVYEFRHDLERIQKRLVGKPGLRVRVLKTTKDEDDWNTGLVDVLVLHPESAGHGLNLQFAGAELLIWFGLTAHLEHFLQANARLIGGHRRDGRNVVIHAIVAEGTRDMDLLPLLGRKGTTQSDLLDAVRQFWKEEGIE